MAETKDINSAEALERSSEEIRHNISEKLESLSKTVDQLGARVNETFDWREQVAKHPYVAIGAAAGLGFLLSGLFRPSPSAGERILNTIGDTIEDIGEKVQSSVEESSFNKSIVPNLIATVGTMVLKSGIDFLLAKAAKGKPESDVATNGRQERPYMSPEEQTNRVV